MKLDYNLIKNILTVIEEHEKHEIMGNELLEKLNIPFKPASKEETIAHDNLVGHIKLLFDYDCIDTRNKALSYGIMEIYNYGRIDGPYRMTNEGYEFLRGLQEKKIFEKIKNLSISVAVDVVKQLLVNLALGKLN